MKKQLGTVLTIAAIAGAVYWLSKRGVVEAADDVARGVTSSSKGAPVNTSGSPVVTTTPIKSGPLGFVKTAVNGAASAVENTVRFGSSAFQNLRANLMQPFGNPASAAADFTSPSNPAARPSSYADIN